LSPRSLGFLVFQSLRKGSYLHDAEISMLSGQLELEGVPNDVVEAVFDGSNAAENAVVFAKLVDVIAERGFDVLVFHRIWDADLPRTLRKLLQDRGLRPVFALHRTKEIGATDPYDCVLGASALEALRAIARAPAPLDPSGIAGLTHRGPDGDLVDNPPGEQEPVIPRWERTSNFRRIRVNPDVAGRPPAVVIHGNPGCPYRKPVSTVPAWRRLKLDPKTTNTRGCAFCDVNLSEEWRHVPEIAEHCVRQIRRVQSDLPDAYEMILLDQDPFPYLPDLVRGLAAAGCGPVHLLIQARADLFLKRTDVFEQALALARAGGHRLSPFLVGIENFHQPTLDFYNKGVTVETNVQVLDYLEDVGPRFADVVDLDKMSPGFILWHPWVTMESLRVNVEALAKTKLMRFRGEVVLSKIRLYPDIPFYWKAKEDGLRAPGSPGGLHLARRALQGPRVGRGAPPDGPGARLGGRPPRVLGRGARARPAGARCAARALRPRLPRRCGNSPPPRGLPRTQARRHGGPAPGGSRAAGTPPVGHPARLWEVRARATVLPGRSL
jgi:hypothetical protein